MALLRTGPLWLVVALAGCDPGPDGAVTTDLYDAVVACKPNGTGCADAEGRRLAPEPLGDEAFLSRDMSQYGAGDGYYLYFEASRRNGARAVLEIDVPLNADAAGLARPRLSYREVLGGATVFESNAATGRVFIPATDSCACQDGLFELRFVAPGADGRAGTPDDQERLLDRGHFGPRDAHCWSPRSLALAAPLEVVPICDGRSAVVGASGDGTVDVDVNVDVSVDVEVEGDVAVDDGGDDVTSAEAAGCADDGTSESGGGCEDSSSSSGCEGDTDTQGCDTGDSSGCSGAGDGASACHVAGHRGLHGRRTQRALGLLLPLAGVGLLHRWLSRRDRRRRQRGR